MNSRVIALGASVIALILGGASQAQAGVLGEIGQQVPDAGVAAKVEANVKVPVAGPSKGSLEADARGSNHPRTTVEAKRRGGGGDSHVVLNLDARKGVSAYADQRRKGKFELEVFGKATPRHAETTASGFARRVGKAEVNGRARTTKVEHVRAARSIPRHARHATSTVLPRPVGVHKKHLNPLQAIGREVGNPMQLGLAGWLIGLAGVMCLGVSRIARRLQRTS